MSSPITHHSPPHLWLAIAAVALLATACYPGAYPIDVYQEMHYQQTHRRLEPDRLAPPEGAVPISGARPAFTFEEAAALDNPVPGSAQTQARARELYRVNCSICHGQDGRGRSVVTEYFTRANLVPPVDLASSHVRARSDGELYWIITNGLGNMPPFRALLREEEVWSVVLFIRDVQGP